MLVACCAFIRGTSPTNGTLLTARAPTARYTIAPSLPATALAALTLARTNCSPSMRCAILSPRQSRHQSLHPSLCRCRRALLNSTPAVCPLPPAHLLSYHAGKFRPSACSTSKTHEVINVHAGDHCPRTAFKDYKQLGSDHFTTRNKHRYLEQAKTNLITDVRSLMIRLLGFFCAFEIHELTLMVQTRRF